MALRYMLQAPNDQMPSTQAGTQGLQCSSFLVMTSFSLRDYDILPKKNYIRASGEGVWGWD